MYTFDSSVENAENTYKVMCESYHRLFQLLDVDILKGI